MRQTPLLVCAPVAVKGPCCSVAASGTIQRRGMPWSTMPEQKSVASGRPSTADDRTTADLPDYYTLLGIAPDAPPGAVATAYRRQAAAVYGVRWRPSQRIRQLRRLNEAYEILGQPSRRAQYDALRLDSGNGADLSPWQSSLASRGLRPLHPAPRSLGVAGAIFCGLISVVVLAVGAQVVQQSLGLDVAGPLGEASGALGVSARPRPTLALPTEVATPLAAANPVAESVAQTPTPVSLQGQFAGSRADVTPQRPPRGTNVSVDVRLRRNDRPAVGIPVFVIAHFRTVDERWPPGDRLLPTDDNGVARITFNIGSATPDHPVVVDAIAMVDGEELRWSASFTPR